MGPRGNWRVLEPSGLASGRRTFPLARRDWRLVARRHVVIRLTGGRNPIPAIASRRPAGAAESVERGIT
jgi:hypothetical protein